jgi:hypothetical protein
MVTSRSSSADYDFVSRFFAPRVGINEDPATGSAHCTLAPFWGERLEKSELVAYQASPRGGCFVCRSAASALPSAGKPSPSCAVTYWHEGRGMEPAWKASPLGGDLER